MRTSRALGLAMLLFAGCVTGQDDPTTVHDLRVLGMQFDPPELLITRCDARSLQQLLAAPAGGGSLSNVDPALLLELLGVANEPLVFRALVADPNGAGRQLDFSLSVCTDSSDRTCANPAKRSLLSQGRYSAATGELVLRVNPVSSMSDAGMPVVRTLSDGTAVLIDVVSNDPYRGLGGIRVPIVLELTAPDTGEKIYAQKLMPYVCKFLPQMQQNLMPVLPGMTAQSDAWNEGQVINLSGRKAIEMLPLDFTALEETYVVPSLKLEPVTLTESWKIAHYATSGTMSPHETGGTNIGGTESKATFKWTPDSKVVEARDVTFYFVVRDGRGGESWITRQAHWTP